MADKRAFTLMELVVAIALMVIVVASAGVIFKVSIGAQRTARANAEIMQKFRAITEQLNSDFAGLRKDAPMLIWFELDPNTGSRYDQIIFFANGDFQSVQLYYPDAVSGVYYPASVVPNPTGVPVPVVSNLARIYYGQANHYNCIAGNPVTGYRFFDTLARRQHLFTADPVIVPFPDISSPAAFASSLNVTDSRNDLYEHDTVSLSQWQVLAMNRDYNNVTVAVNVERPRIDLVNARKTGLHMLLAQEVNNFSIQWAYQYNNSLFWWPEYDSDPDSPTFRRDFGAMATRWGLAAYAFGLYFNIGTNLNGWFPPAAIVGPYYPDPVPEELKYPRVLKFTFTIRDSRRVFPAGQTFTHIIYLDK